jgi:sporulation protein YlmC with PRC-barrel domain
VKVFALAELEIGTVAAQRVVMPIPSRERHTALSRWEDDGGAGPTGPQCTTISPVAPLKIPRPSYVDTAEIIRNEEKTMKHQMIRIAAVIALAATPVSSQTLAQAVTASATAIPFVTQQPKNEWLARVFLGQDVHNLTGERVGDVNDLIFDRQGRISTIVVGVGGFLGMGEKNVGVPYPSLTFNVGKAGERVIVIAASKEDLMKAPTFVATEKTILDKVKDKAADIGHKTVDKAVELKDKGVQKIEEMKKTDPAK